MKVIDAEPIIRRLDEYNENAEELPPLSIGDFIRMMKEAMTPPGTGILTNLDRVRAMSAGELAEVLAVSDIDEAGIDFCSAEGFCPHRRFCYELDSGDGCYYHRDKPVRKAHRMMWEDWLKAEWDGSEKWNTGQKEARTE